MIAEAGSASGARVGDRVFVPGARCFGDVRGLFGGAAARVVVPGDKVVAVDDAIGEQAVLLALAATAYHAVAAGATPPDLIVGHGVLGRLLARIALLRGGDPVVWEQNPQRRDGAEGYRVVNPAEDLRRDYRAIYDVSGDPGLLDTLIAGWRRAARSCSPASTASRSASPSPRPSCARRACASPPNGSSPT